MAKKSVCRKLTKDESEAGVYEDGAFVVKRCTIDQIEPPPVDLCREQSRRQKTKAGIWVCDDPPIPEPEPPPDVFGICIERIKNFPIEISMFDFPIVCKVERKIPGLERCEAIAAETAAKPDYRYPNCPRPPPLPPPPVMDVCERQELDRKKAECKERWKRYLQ